MNERIVVLALLVAVLSLAAAGAVFLCCRRLRREKNRSIVRVLREQDRVARELERTRIERETIERVLRARLSEPAEPSPGAGDGPDMENQQSQKQ